MLLLCLLGCTVLRKIANGFVNASPYSYSSPPVDLDSSSDTSFDLSASFEQEIRSRRANTNPAKQSTHNMAASNSRVDNVPDADSTINRMFTGLDLEAVNNKSTEESLLMDVPEPSLFERLSPCKRVGLTRPSTVAEESLLSVSRSFRTVALASEMAGETSFGTANSAKEYSGNFTRDSLFPWSLSSNSDRFDQDSLNIDKSEEKQYVGDCVANDCTADDTLEDVEYDHNDSKYVLKPIRKLERLESAITVDSSPENVIQLNDDDSDPESSYQTAWTHARTETEASSSQIDRSEQQHRDNSSLESARNRSRSVADGINDSNVISLLDSDSDVDNDIEHLDVDESDDHAVEHQIEHGKSVLRL